eukprot:6194042-Pleurochrysis_carterae.AAC.6
MTGYKALSKVFETRFHMAFCCAQNGPSARCTHTTQPPASGIIDPSSAVISPIGSDQNQGRRNTPKRVSLAPPAPTESSRP